MLIYEILTESDKIPPLELDAEDMAALSDLAGKTPPPPPVASLDRTRRDRAGFRPNALLEPEHPEIERVAYFVQTQDVTDMYGKPVGGSAIQYIETNYCTTTPAVAFGDSHGPGYYHFFYVLGRRANEGIRYAMKATPAFFPTPREEDDRKRRDKPNDWFAQHVKALVGRPVAPKPSDRFRVIDGGKKE